MYELYTSRNWVKVLRLLAHPFLDRVLGHPEDAPSSELHKEKDVAARFLSIDLEPREIADNIIGRGIVPLRCNRPSLPSPIPIQ